MEEGQKLYYTIGEVSQLLSENTSLVRFWSDTFSSFIKPVRNKKGNRLFTAKDVENFKLIHHFVKDLGMTLDGAKLRMKQNATGEDKRLEVIGRLKQIRAKLLAVTDENDETPDDEFDILTDLEDGEEEN
ncbi:MAG: MerR family transcriptional regulator [Bacteroidales bacterium]|nr:MerR family transcriptional regulator [Bacteroidales bacterium]